MRKWVKPCGKSHGHSRKSLNHKDRNWCASKGPTSRGVPRHLTRSATMENYNDNLPTIIIAVIQLAAHGGRWLAALLIFVMIGYGIVQIRSDPTMFNGL